MTTCSVKWVQAMLVIKYFDEITIFEVRNGLSTNQICRESSYLQWYVASHGNILSNLQAATFVAWSGWNQQNLIIRLVFLKFAKGYQQTKFVEKVLICNTT